MDSIEAGFAPILEERSLCRLLVNSLSRLPPETPILKYGYIKESDSFVIKIASGFYDNPKHGLPVQFRIDACILTENRGAAGSTSR